MYYGTPNSTSIHNLVLPPPVPSLSYTLGWHRPSNPPLLRKPTAPHHARYLGRASLPSLLTRSLGHWLRPSLHPRQGCGRAATAGPSAVGTRCCHDTALPRGTARQRSLHCRPEALTRNAPRVSRMLAALISMPCPAYNRHTPAHYFFAQGPSGLAHALPSRESHSSTSHQCSYASFYRGGIS